MNKKLLSIKTLFVAAGLCVGASAWADDVTTSIYYNGCTSADGWAVPSGASETRGSIQTNNSGGISGNCVHLYQSVSTGKTACRVLDLSAYANTLSNYSSWTIDFYLKYQTPDNSKFGGAVALYSDQTTASTMSGYSTPDKYFYCAEIGGTTYTENASVTQNGTASAWSMACDTYYHYIITVSGSTATYTITSQDGNTTLSSGSFAITSSWKLGGIYLKSFKSRIDEINIKAVVDHTILTNTDYYVKVATFDFTDINIANDPTSGKKNRDIYGFNVSSINSIQFSGTYVADAQINGLKFGNGKSFNIYEDYGLGYGSGTYSETSSIDYSRNVKSTQVMELFYNVGGSSAESKIDWSDENCSYLHVGYNSSTSRLNYPLYNYTIVKELNVYEPLASASVQTTIGEAGYATFSAPCALDFSEVEGLTAYTAALNDAKTAVELTQVDNVPAGTGVILEGSAATYTIPAIASSSTAKGILTPTLWRTVPDTGNNYVLSKEGGVVGFYKLPDGGAVQACHAYLNVPASARSFYGFDNNEDTGINAVQSAPLTNRGYYNLNGQRIENPSKGLYILNGRKVVIK